LRFERGQVKAKRAQRLHDALRVVWRRAYPDIEIDRGSRVAMKATASPRTSRYSTRFALSNLKNSLKSSVSSGASRYDPTHGFDGSQAFPRRSPPPPLALVRLIVEVSDTHDRAVDATKHGIQRGQYAATRARWP